MVRVPYTVAFTRVSGVATANNRWKGEGSGDGGESEPAEGRAIDDGKGSTKAFQTRASGKGRNAPRWLFALYLF